MRRTVEHQGSQIAFEMSGAGPPILLIQGVGLHGEGWRPQIEELEKDFSCIRFDNRGTGGSLPLTLPFTVEQMANDALAVLNSTPFHSAHLVGHSLGGLIALQLALTARARVRSLSLLCTFANGKAVAPLTPRMIWLGLRSQIGTPRMRRHAFLRLVLSAEAVATHDLDALGAELAHLFGHDLATQPPAASHQLRAMRQVDLTNRLAELQGIPTLVLVGRQDPIAPPALGQALARGIPAAQYREYADASHGLPIQHPRRVNSELRTHLIAAEKGHANPDSFSNS